MKRIPVKGGVQPGRAVLVDRKDFEDLEKALGICPSSELVAPWEEIVTIRKAGRCIGQSVNRKSRLDCQLLFSPVLECNGERSSPCCPILKVPQKIRNGLSGLHWGIGKDYGESATNSRELSDSMSVSHLYETIKLQRSTGQDWTCLTTGVTSSWHAEHHLVRFGWIQQGKSFSGSTRSDARCSSHQLVVIYFQLQKM